MIQNKRIESLEFKLVKSAFLLVIFQILSSMVVALLIYLITDVFKIISYNGPVSVSIPGAFGGCYLFGNLVEKRKPGILTKQKIAHVVQLSIVIECIISALFLFLSPIEFSLKGLLYLSVLILIIYIPLYFMMKNFINIGIKNAQR